MIQEEYDALDREAQVILEGTLLTPHFIMLLAAIVRKFDTQLANLTTNCTPEEFQLKYAKLKAERQAHIEMQDFINNLRNGEEK